jgi:hypothetical protein
MREEPPNRGVLKDCALLDPEVADQSPAARVHALDELFREGRHLRAQAKDEWKWFRDIQERVHQGVNERRCCNRK